VRVVAVWAGEVWLVEVWDADMSVVVVCEADE